MPIFILVGKLVLLVCIKSVLIMSLPARTINKTPLNLLILSFFAEMPKLLIKRKKGRKSCKHMLDCCQELIVDLLVANRSTTRQPWFIGLAVRIFVGHELFDFDRLLSE